MSESARVTSIDAVKDFQAALATFCEDAQEALGAVDMEASRLLDWVQHEQLNYWQRAVRDRYDDLAQAKAELYRKQLGRLTGEKVDCIEEEKAVRRAQWRLQEAEDKVDKCKQWGRLLERAIDEYQAPSQQLAALVEGKPPRAVVLLHQIIGRLDAYVGLAPSSSGSTPAAPPAPAATPPAAEAASGKSSPPPADDSRKA